MVSASMAADPLSDFEHRRELRRAVIASTIGTTIEWYDFLLYSIASGLVFARVTALSSTFARKRSRSLLAKIGPVSTFHGTLATHFDAGAPDVLGIIW